MLLDIGVERLTGYALHDVAGERGAIVGVGLRGACVEHPLGHPSFQQDFEPGAVRILRYDALGLLLEACGVLHEVAHGDGFAVARRDLVVEVLVDVGIQVDLALLDLLHDRCPGEQLGDGPGSEKSLFRVDRRALRDIREPITALGQDLPVLDDRDDRARDIARLQGIRHVTIEPGVDVLRRQCHCCRGACGSGRGVPEHPRRWRRAPGKWQ